MARLNQLDHRAPTLSASAQRVAGFQFIEADQGVDVGVHRAALYLPAYATLTDITVEAVALWASTTAALVAGLYAVDTAYENRGGIGTVIDADRWFEAVDLTATDLTVGQSISFLRAGGKGGTGLTEGTSTHLLGATAAVDRYVVIDVTTGSAPGAPNTGVTLAYVSYSIPELDAVAFTPAP